MQKSPVLNGDFVFVRAELREVKYNALDELWCGNDLLQVRRTWIALGTTDNGDFPGALENVISDIARHGF